jgi:hypothetical protein
LIPPFRCPLVLLMKEASVILIRIKTIYIYLNGKIINIIIIMHNPYYFGLKKYYLLFRFLSRKCLKLKKSNFKEWFEVGNK